MPSPCGPYAECRDIGGTPSCSCLANYIGSPPNCRPECIINSDCSSNTACMREKCRDPCPGSCGANAQCNVIIHTPTCTCPEGYTGDPFNQCYPKPPPRKHKQSTLRKYKYIWVSRYLLTRYFYSRKCTSYNRPMFSISLWTKCTMQGRHLHMFTRIPRRPVFRMPSRMRSEYRLSS